MRTQLEPAQCVTLPVNDQQTITWTVSIPCVDISSCAGRLTHTHTHAQRTQGTVTWTVFGRMRGHQGVTALVYRDTHTHTHRSAPLRCCVAFAGRPTRCPLRTCLRPGVLPRIETQPAPVRANNAQRELAICGCRSRVSDKANDTMTLCIYDTFASRLRYRVENLNILGVCTVFLRSVSSCCMYCFVP